MFDLNPNNVQSLRLRTIESACFVSFVCLVICMLRFIWFADSNRAASGCFLFPLPGQNEPSVLHSRVSWQDTHTLWISPSRWTLTSRESFQNRLQPYGPSKKGLGWPSQSLIEHWLATLAKSKHVFYTKSRKENISKWFCFSERKLFPLAHDNINWTVCVCLSCGNACSSRLINTLLFNWWCFYSDLLVACDHIFIRFAAKFNVFGSNFSCFSCPFIFRRWKDLTFFTYWSADPFQSDHLSTFGQIWSYATCLYAEQTMTPPPSYFK